MDHILLMRHPAAIMKTSLEQADDMNRIAKSSLDFRTFKKRKDNKNCILQLYDINIGQRKRSDKR